MFIPIGSPEARSSEGVDAGHRKGQRSQERMMKILTVWITHIQPVLSSICLPREADPSRPGWPILPFSFFPKSRPMEDLMLFFLLDLWRESWLLLELLPSAERLRGRQRKSHKGKAQDALRSTTFHISAPLSFVKKTLLPPLPAKLPGVVEHRARVGEGHPVQSQRTRSGRRRRVEKSEGPIIIFVVLEH